MKIFSVRFHRDQENDQEVRSRKNLQKNQNFSGNISQVDVKSPLAGRILAAGQEYRNMICCITLNKYFTEYADFNTAAMFERHERCRKPDGFHVCRECPA